MINQEMNMRSAVKDQSEGAAIRIATSPNRVGLTASRWRSFRSVVAAVVLSVIPFTMARAQTEVSPADGQTNAAGTPAAPKPVPLEDPIAATEERCRQCQLLNDEDAYQLLKAWVIPETIPTNWRLSAFRLKDEDPLARPPSTNVRGLKFVPLVHGTRIGSAAWELIEAAKRLKRLDELKAEIDACEPRDDLARRNQLALQILVDVARKDDLACREKLKRQLVLLKSLDPNAVTTRDPEQLVILALIEEPDHLLAAKSLAEAIWERYELGLQYATLQSVKSLIATIDQRIADLPSLSAVEATPAAATHQWHRGPMNSSRLDDSGSHSAEWTIERGVATVRCGEVPSQLYFQSPLTGDFEVNCDLTMSKFCEGSVAYGMFGVCPYWDLRGTFTLPVLRPRGTLMERLEIPEWDNVVHVRTLVAEGKTLTYVNGVHIHTHELKPVPDPWLVLQPFNPWYSTSVRDLRITGNPTIPDEIYLSQITGLENWRADYYAETMGATDNVNTQWVQFDDEIISRRTRNRRPDNAMGVLIHQRPLSFDGEVTFECYYDPGKSELHPALGNLAWVISPDHVKTRRLPRIQSVPQTATADESAIERQVATGLVPLRWNRVRLSLEGSKVVLAVNDVNVHETLLDPSNTRQFALFREAHIPRGRVRAVKWRGHWPKTLPPVEEQELALPADGISPRSEWALTGRLKLNTSLEELRKLTFWFNNPDEFFHVTPEGVELTMKPDRPGSWVTELAWPHALRGDFDVTTTLSKIQLESKSAPEVSLRINFDDEVKSGLAVIIGENRQGIRYAMGDHIRRPADDSYWFDRWSDQTQMTNGRLRITRTAGRASLYYADGDGPYRLLTTYSVGNADVKSVGLWTQIHGPDGNLKAVYKDLTILGDEIVD